MRCVGIDLAWSPRNNSAGFALEVEGGVAREIAWCETLANDDQIMGFIDQMAGHGPALVAMDAPIAVPNASGARPCDREITRLFGRFQAGAHPANRRALGRYGGLRAERLARRIVQELAFAHHPYIDRHTATRQLIEVYPHPGMVSLFGLDRTLKYKRGPIDRRRAELDRLQAHLLALKNEVPALRVSGGWRQEITKLGGRALKQYEDLLDSLFCAYTVAYCWTHGPTHYEVFGTVEKGHILVPIPPKQRSRIGLPRVETLTVKCAR